MIETRFDATRCIGLLLLADFAIVFAIKVAQGAAEEILWMSHVGLLVAGIGSVRRSAFLKCTA
ncbi:MAG: hypothetical protein JSU86_06785, partial [Phycisphaerales bacterium]